jgi:hypothetical protein
LNTNWEVKGSWAEAVKGSRRRGRRKRNGNGEREWE